jgi:peptidyl-prolyl cis-trans isomerase SurA
MNRLIASGLILTLGTLAPSLLMTSSAQQTPAAAPGAAASERGQAIEGVAVLVNDAVISYSDVRNRTRLILLSLGAQPDEETLGEAQQRAIESLIEEQIQIQEFKELAKDAEITDEEIDRDLEAIARQNGVTLQAFIADLEGRGVSAQTLRHQVKADISWNNIVRGRFARQVRVSELRVNEMMERLAGSLGKPQYRLAEIFLYAPDTESRNNAKARADTLQRQIEQGAQFERVAQQFSAAPSASAGGDLGWLTPGDMRPEVVKAVEAATAPAFLPPIETEGGVYIYALLGKREPADPLESRLNLRQISARTEDAAARLNALRATAKTCEAAGDAAKAAELTSLDLDDVALADMSPAFQTALLPLRPGESTEPLDISGGKGVLFVCSRKQGGEEMPSREQIRARLFDNELTMLADRFLRDLKREATIIRR